MAAPEKRLMKLARGNAAQREAAEVARRVYREAVRVGPHQIAADFGMPSDLETARVGSKRDLETIALRFARHRAPAPYLDIAAEYARIGFERFVEAEQIEDAVSFEMARQLGEQLGPWPLRMGGCSGQEIAEELADQNPQSDRASLIAGALAGFRAHLEQARLTAYLDTGVFDEIDETEDG